MTQVFQIHIEGKKHLKKVKLLSHIWRGSFTALFLSYAQFLRVVETVAATADVVETNG